MSKKTGPSGLSPRSGIHLHTRRGATAHGPEAPRLRTEVEARQLRTSIRIVKNKVKQGRIGRPANITTSFSWEDVVNASQKESHVH